MTTPTTLQQLVQIRLAEAGAGPLDEFILTRRADGPGRLSYARITDEIKALTGLYLTAPTIRSWEQQFATEPKAEVTP